MLNISSKNSNPVTLCIRGDCYAPHRVIIVFILSAVLLHHSGNEGGAASSVCGPGQTRRKKQSGARKTASLDQWSHGHKLITYSFFVDPLEWAAALECHDCRFSYFSWLAPVLGWNGACGGRARQGMGEGVTATESRPNFSTCRPISTRSSSIFRH